MTTPYTSAAQIATDIGTRLSAITKANGCETDLGTRVFRGRKNVDENMVPCAVVIEGPDTPQDRPGRLPTAFIKQRYIIGAYVPCEVDHPNDAAHAALRDLKRAMFKADGNFGGKVSKVTYGGRDIGPRLDGYPVVFVTLYLDVEYVEDLTNP